MSHQLWTTLIKYNISPNQVYFLDCCRNRIKATGIINSEAEANICRAKGYINEQGQLTEKALVILDEFETYLVKVKKKVATEVLGDKFLEKIAYYRELFPAKSLPSGSMARQSVEELKKKFEDENNNKKKNKDNEEGMENLFINMMLLPFSAVNSATQKAKYEHGKKKEEQDKKDKEEKLKKETEKLEKKHQKEKNLQESISRIKNLLK